MIPTFNRQIEAMRSAWPSFKKVRVRAGRSVRWIGTLRPALMTYEIEITYQVPLIIERIDPLRQQPRVRVVAPPLKPRKHDPQGALPHVYWDDPERPALCLFDHEDRQWSPFDLLADTTVPWTIDWLACYEGWRATGEWTGGGRHLTEQQEAS
jgi:hypothetical protein